jgi:hypothetical protein
MELEKKKYLLQNGVLTLNPRYNHTPNSSTTNFQSPHLQQQISSHGSILPLAIISSQDDVPMIQQLQSDNGIVITEEMPFSTMETIRYMQTPEYCSYFNVTSERNLFDELCAYFIRYEIPIGLVTKLLVLRDYRLNFMVDDSGDLPSLITPLHSLNSHALRFNGKSN